MNYSSLHVKQLISPWSLAVHYYYYQIYCISLKMKFELIN